jgi:hypothetical protein
MLRAALDEPLASQISPDKNMNCHDTTAGFTVQREFVAFVVMCQLDPAAQPYIRAIHHIRVAHPSGQLKRFKIIPDDFVCSSARRFALRLPSDNPSRACLCHRLVVMIANMINAEFSDRGLAPHKFMPMLGVHRCSSRRRRFRASSAELDDALSSSHCVSFSHFDFWCWGI